jgi:heme-degrading monooxygenase HmoA
MTLLSNLTVHAPRQLSRCKSLLVIMVLVSTGGCDSDEKTKSSEIAGAGCTHDQLEADLQTEGFMGPLVDPTTRELKLVAGEQYVVSSTYGVPKPGEDGAPLTERYRQLFGAVEQQLKREPGLLALQLSQSDACGSGRTLAIWKTEDQMYDFVLSQAHRDAMSAASEILQPGYAVTHWSATSTGQMTLAEATRQLAEVDVTR